jgi:hypothetical protein
MLYGNHIKKNEMGEACTTYGERRGVIQGIDGGEPEGKRQH